MFNSKGRYNCSKIASSKKFFLNYILINKAFLGDRDSRLDLLSKRNISTLLQNELKGLFQPNWAKSIYSGSVGLK